MLKRASMKPPTPLLLALLLPLFSRAAEPRRVEVARDLWISSHPAEIHGNNGGSPKLKLKGVQEFFLIDFDPEPLRGKKVTRAQLHVQLAGNEKLGRVSVSTITEPWVEGDGYSYARKPGASSFAWAKTDEARWRGGEPDITNVILGSGGSVWGFGDPTEPDAAQWQIIPIEPAVVQARLDGRGEGFCVMDDVGSEYRRDGNAFEYRPFLNRYLASREAKKDARPYFTLWLEDAPTPPAPKTATAPSQSVTAGKLPPATKAPGTQKLPFPVLDEFGEPLRSLEFFAAKKETIGFSVAAPLADVALDLPGVKVRRFDMPKIADFADPLVPEGFAGPLPIANPTSAGTFLEIFIPAGTKAGKLTGTLRVGQQRAPFTVTVWNFTLPDRLSFIPQMNCYGLPEGERDFYRLAHEHRTCLNWLPYGWTGRVKAAPEIRADGSWNWRAWDERFGPLLDGSAFADLPRGAVPIDAFYLPLNENWPMDHERHFRGGYWIESAYDDDYWRQFRDAAARFTTHFAERGWKETMFEFYLNNKVGFKAQRGGRWDITSAAWILDEPSNTQDFWALRWFGKEFWRGVPANSGVRLTYRADISRPQWQRDLLDNVTSVEVVSGALRTYRERVVERAAAFKNLVYLYGAANRPGTPNIMPAAWCVEAWALGADGVVPWQTIGAPESWQKADELALFYPTASGPVPSVRLKSFRAGQSLVEYLTIYAALSKQDRASVAAAVAAEPGLAAKMVKKSEDDAGSSQFGKEAHGAFVSLRQRLGMWLDAQAPAPRERWHDPRPPVRDPSAIREITALPAPQ